MTALSWAEWSKEHPLRMKVIPAQDDQAIVKPEVLHLYRGGAESRSLQVTREELATALRMEYYDPRRQDSIAEHDCDFEDGTWWFGHGMPCLHPQLHATPEVLAEALCAAMPHPGGGSLLVYEDALEATQKVLGGED